jgi:hypothetical protein
MHSTHVRPIAIIFLACLLAGDMMAGGSCFRGRPLPECRSFWITEAGTLYRFDSHDAGKNRKWHEKLMYNWELGWMYNRSPRSALGGSFFLDYDDLLNNTQIGIRARHRRWLSRSLSLDVAPGVIVTGSAIECPGFSGLLVLNAADRVAATLRLDISKWERSSGYDLAWYGGLRFCSYPGLIAGLAGPIIAAIIWSSEHDSDGRLGF